MDFETLCGAILDSIPSRIVYADTEYIIRFLNAAARKYYADDNGNCDLIGKSMFDCHHPKTADIIKGYVQRLSDGENEIYLGVTSSGERFYMNAVRDKSGKLIGFFERFERNLHL